MVRKFQFDVFTFDGSGRRLLRDGDPVRLAGKAFQALGLLIERRPEAVGKDEFLETLWPDGGGSEDHLTTLINQVRTALGDTTRPPRFIRTVHGYGYAFEGAEVAGTREPGGRRSAGWLHRDDRPLALFEGENVIGRAPACALCVDDASVSRRHAQVTVEDGVARVADLGSTNGTFVNDVPVSGPVPLADSDVVRVGEVAFTFRAAARGSETKTVALPRGSSGSSGGGA
jgi:DNA-binding winged helix-turn-helix (wHTH) protein